MTSHEENARVLIEAWKLMVGRLPEPDIRQAAGLATTFAHVPLPFLNLSMQDRPAAGAGEFQALLDVARERSAGCAHGTMLAVLEPWVPADWEHVAADAGLAFLMPMTGMVLTGELTPPRRPLPKLEIRRVSDPATARDAAMINAHAYGMPPEMFECIANQSLWHEDSFGYVGYVDGRAVSTASSLPAGGTVYIALVATMPDSHGKGYADAVMRQAIEAGRAGMGVMRTTLHATDMGQPVYRAMGFESGGRWVLLGSAEGH
jgi:GNAT superfamily N-acetyltransferase